MLHDDHRGVELQQWYNVWRMEGSWRGPWDSLSQVHFVRDDLKYLFPKFQPDIQVVATHTSKSVKLPVYSIHLVKGYWRDGRNGHGTCRIQMRYNFYDWKISVFDPWNNLTDIKEDFQGLWNYDQPNLNPCYFEGFEERHVNSPIEYAIPDDGYSFSAEIYNNYHLWTMMWLLNKHLEKGITDDGS